MCLRKVDRCNSCAPCQLCSCAQTWSATDPNGLHPGVAVQHPEFRYRHLNAAPIIPNTMPLDLCCAAARLFRLLLSTLWCHHGLCAGGGRCG